MERQAARSFCLSAAGMGAFNLASRRPAAIVDAQEHGEKARARYAAHMAKRGGHSESADSIPTAIRRKTASQRGMKAPARAQIQNQGSAQARRGREIFVQLNEVEAGTAGAG